MPTNDSTEETFKIPGCNSCQKECDWKNTEVTAAGFWNLPETQWDGKYRCNTSHIYLKKDDLEFLKVFKGPSAD